MRKQDRARAQSEVIYRTVASCVSDAARGADWSAEDWVRDTIYEEFRRLDAMPNQARSSTDRTTMARARKQLLRGNAADHKGLLNELVHHFTDEIVGNFDPRVYALTTRVLPPSFALLLNALSPRRLAAQLPHAPTLSTNVHVRGHTDGLRELAKRGTVILCPTHLSNLDSPVIGWALYHMGLDPFLYGAGLNLFTNPLISFFMHNLGAYRVDRRKQNRLYKKTLKEYCRVSLEYGYHNLFFPGGTRSRSGAVEPHLKLGLMGCAPHVFVNNLRAGRERPRLFIVPCTISYQLVLEAETLIGDYLQSMGKARYIIERDESSRLWSVGSFLAGIASMDSRIYVNVSEAIDPFGNRVLPDGESYDTRGRRVDPAHYVLRDGQPTHDDQRDAEYTREVADAMIATYRADATLQCTNIVAYVLFESLRAKHRELDFYRLLLLAPEQCHIDRATLCRTLDRLLAKARELHSDNRLRLAPPLLTATASEVLTDAVRVFCTYHERAAVTLETAGVGSDNLRLLFYYHNRASGYGLGTCVTEGQRPLPPLDLSRRLTGEPLFPRSGPPPALRPANSELS